MKKLSRNDRCRCNSGKKYKYCCMLKDEKAEKLSLFDKFSVIVDPRDNRGKKYLLMDLFVMVIYGVLNEYEDFVNMADFLKLNESYFKNLLLIKKTPSHDCLSDLFSVLDPKKFMEIFIDWARELVQRKTGITIAFDGKAVRSARDKINGGNTPYILSAYLTEAGISVGQVGVKKKSNEMAAIPDLLDLIDVKGNYITIDSIGTQKKIMDKIVSLEGHFVLKVKDNQRILREDIETYFTNNIDNESAIRKYATNFEKNHGREEYREYYLSYSVSCITNKEKWDKVSAIGMVRVFRKTGDKLDVKEHHYVMDTKISMEMFVKATRSHWNIECGLHWRLDVILNEDKSRNRVANSVENLSIIRKIAFNLVRADQTFGNVTFKKKLSRYRHDFSNIERLIFEVLPKIS